MDGRVGEPYPRERLHSLHDEIDRRYAEKTPPGYSDLKNKSKDLARGDAIVWYQMMDFAKTNKKPIIFVTRDAKEDWWLRHNGQTIQPRPELRREFLEATGLAFYAYTTSRFIELAKENLGKDISDAFIAEAKHLADVAPSQRVPSFSGDHGFAHFPGEVLIDRDFVRERSSNLLQGLVSHRHDIRQQIRHIEIEFENIRERITRIVISQDQELTSDERNIVEKLDRRARDLSLNLAKLKNMNRTITDEINIVRERAETSLRGMDGGNLGDS